ncbi:hypothetical protein ACIG5E_32810 [Kitasatospora sp. NPDC053057]|uniref:hypothetical protein n=1 Tax=Kitasatospora sp. NPDC053057 TaxID=3364062 RepID=UPI0037CBF142
MSESVPTAAAPTRSVRGSWWLAPLISTAVTLMLMAPAFLLLGLGAMATDPCTSNASCPAEPYLKAAALALKAAQIAVLLQWPAAWLFRRARVVISLAPVAALAVELVAVANAGSSTM